MTMSEKKDKTQELLEQLLSELYKKQSLGATPSGQSYLIAADKQYLGKISKDIYDNQSITNHFGPYGSQFSSTSIFNQYSLYGSQFSIYSINNPYTTTPPQLFLNDKMVGFVTANEFLANRIPNDIFLYALENDVDSLLDKKIVNNEILIRQSREESFLLAYDGTYLGSLVNAPYDQMSIFNKFGPYGSEFSPTSIFNRFSQYGSFFSHLSPFNKFSTTPPKVYIKGKLAGFLTVNQFLAGNKYDPEKIVDWAKEGTL